jgi:hypothetical protein
MTPEARFRINQPAVIGQVIEGEAIVVNLDSGAYYSLDRAGADVWNLIEQGATVQDIISGITARYAGEAPTIRAAVLQLVEGLQQENLIVSDTVSAGPMPAEILSDGDKPLFQVPVLHKYTDMAELLLLDPIHDVGEMGWPQTDPARE